MSFRVENVTESTVPHMLSFLKPHEDKVLFLLGNFQEHGFKLTDDANSANYKLIKQDKEIVTVFCLTRRGNLLVYSDVHEPVYDLILQSCLKESVALTGLIGHWEFCNKFWSFLKLRNAITSETHIEKEALYSIDLHKVSYPPQHGVRLLTANDFNVWRQLRLNYIREMELPTDLTDTQMRTQLLREVKQATAWGYFQDDQLVSVADLNAKAFDLGQVGGVYTAPEHRKKGLSKAVMQQLMTDCKSMHGIRKLVIFTGEKNTAARHLYESLGVSQVGHYALLFGQR